MEKTENKLYNPSGIKIYRELKFMQTNITLGPNNKHYMTLFTYIDDTKINPNIGIKNLKFVELYDSLSEAEKQAQLNCMDLSKINFYTVQVNMSGTVFDELCTDDINRLADLYEKYKQEILDAYKTRKDKKITLDTTAILYLKQIENNICIIRSTRDVKSDKHDLKCINKRKIIVYQIIDTSIIANCQMVPKW